MTHFPAHQSVCVCHVFLHVCIQGRYLPSFWKKADRRMVFCIFEGPFNARENTGPSSFVVPAGKPQGPSIWWILRCEETAFENNM